MMALNGGMMSSSTIYVITNTTIVENQWEFILVEGPPKPRCRHSAITFKG